ncbi:MAG TPA: aldo/keto reductase [Rhodanobacteraceae bacterium]|nr:aldo/keto reductase [Rhodanobacteraceae bacterium]
MRTRALGPSGLQVSEVGLGCNNFGGRIDEAATRKVVDAALGAGIDFFDTADSYGNKGGSETLLGKILGARRKDVVLATKFGSSMREDVTRHDASRRYIMRAVEGSLRRLQTDWIDVYYLHWPDPQTPIEETLRALDDLVRGGKVRYIGACNLAAWQVVEAEWTARELGTHHFACAQNEYSLVERTVEKELLPALAAYDLGLVPYFPLASGLLTGKYHRDKPAPDDSRFAQWQALGERYQTASHWDRVEKLEAWCKVRGHTLLELAFAWLLAHGEVASVIAGATKPEQIAQNAKAADWRLDADDLAEIDKALEAPMPR